MARRLGFHPMPEQVRIFDVAGELDDDGSLWYGEVNVWGPRRMGKTAVATPVATHRMTEMARRFGPQELAYTAQSRDAARGRLEKDFAKTLRSRAARRWFSEIEKTSKTTPSELGQWKLSLNNGHEHIQLFESFLRIAAPTRSGLHGDDLDLGMIDECFALLNADVETAMGPAQATRRSPQLWRFSAAGDVKSAYMYRHVLAGRAAAESGAHGRIASFEWGAPDDMPPGDPRTWYLAHPALGLTVRESFLEAKWAAAVREGVAGINKFRRSYLNQWPEIPMLDELVPKLFVPGVWEAACSSKLPQPEGDVFALAVNPERSMAAIGVSGVAGTCGMWTCRPGVSWAVPELVRVAKAHGARVAVPARGAASTEIDALVAAGVDVLEVSGPEFAVACGQMYDAVTDAARLGRPFVRHAAELDAAVASTAKRASGDGFVWDRRTGDICAFEAVTVARWAAMSGAIDMAGQVW